MVPCEDAIQLPISVEEALKIIVSGGAVMSDLNRGHVDEALSRLRRE
jgi:uncharacterized membrane protein